MSSGHTCESRAKAVAVTPKEFCCESNGFTIWAVLINCYKQLKISALLLFGKNSRLVCMKNVLKITAYF
jgi:hypothetical protein